LHRIGDFGYNQDRSGASRSAFGTSNKRSEEQRKSPLLQLLHLLLHLSRYGRALNCLLACGVTTAWFAGTGLLVLHRHRFRRLSHIELPPDVLETLPMLSVLVPACNEAATVEQAMQSLLAMNYPHMEIIAVNDRSTDGTGALLERLAAENPRLRVRHVTALPAGWLGKNHALHVASQVATGDWLLFTDADVVYAPDALLRAVSHARSVGADHLVVSPRIDTRDFWERLFASYFSLMLTMRCRVWDVADPDRSAYFGFGAFNMVRTSAYRAFGGHGALAMEVVDDTKLGKVVKQNGFRTELVDGSDLLSVRWVVGFRGVMQCLTKNAFAGFDFSMARMLMGVSGLLLTAVYPIATLLFSTPCRWLALGTLLGMMSGAGAMRRFSNTSCFYGLAYPLAALMLVYIILHSTWIACRRQGIVWRGTLYPLDELKRGVV
jgi:cellulose synthase/poly-beta-1,6-N-acetylglucosamine synthase-like glycosyltransferase